MCSGEVGTSLAASTTAWSPVFSSVTMVFPSCRPVGLMTEVLVGPASLTAWVSWEQLWLGYWTWGDTVSPSLTAFIWL